MGKPIALLTATKTKNLTNPIFWTLPNRSHNYPAATRQPTIRNAANIGRAQAKMDEKYHQMRAIEDCLRMCFLMRAREKSDDFGDAICESVSYIKVRRLKSEKSTGSIWRLPGTKTSLPCSYPVATLQLPYSYPAPLPGKRYPVATLYSSRPL